MYSVNKKVTVYIMLIRVYTIVTTPTDLGMKTMTQEVAIKKV
jgi:hypothetical protein